VRTALGQIPRQRTHGLGSFLVTNADKNARAANFGGGEGNRDESEHMPAHHPRMDTVHTQSKSLVLERSSPLKTDSCGPADAKRSHRSARLGWVTLWVIDFPVDEALEVLRASFGIDWIAVQVVLQSVVSGHQCRCQVPREQIAPGVTIMARADVPIAVSYALVGQDVVRGHEIFNQLWVGRPVGMRGAR
jgi:hypothetical protein